jgi:hypothetical protein
MRSARARIAGLLVAATLLGAVPTTGVEAHVSRVPTAVVAKSCSSGFTHAVLPSGQKCLRAGQFCSRKRSFQRVYRRKGFYCRSNRHLGYS